MTISRDTYLNAKSYLSKISARSDTKYYKVNVTKTRELPSAPSGGSGGITYKKW